MDKADQVLPGGVDCRIPQCGLGQLSVHGQGGIAGVVAVGILQGVSHLRLASPWSPSVQVGHGVEYRLVVSVKLGFRIDPEPSFPEGEEAAGHQLLDQREHVTRVLARDRRPVPVVIAPLVQEPVQIGAEVLSVQSVVAGDGRSAGQPLLDSEELSGVLGGVHYDGQAERVERPGLYQLGFLLHAAFGQRLFYALLHLAGRVACERQQQDVPR